MVLATGLAGCASLGTPAPTAPELALAMPPPIHFTNPATVLHDVELPALPEQPDEGTVGTVSWYGRALAGRPTASGERFDPAALTMAHRQLPFGTRVRITNPENGRSVVVRVNDRGPFVGERVADVSHAAARELGFVKKGVILARLDVLAPAE